MWLAYLLDRRVAPELSEIGGPSQLPQPGKVVDNAEDGDATNLDGCKDEPRGIERIIAEPKLGVTLGSVRSQHAHLLYLQNFENPGQGYSYGHFGFESTKN